MLPPIPQNQEEWAEREDGVLSRKITTPERSSCHIQREKVIQLIEGALRINSAILPAQGTIV